MRCRPRPTEPRSDLSEPRPESIEEAIALHDGLIGEVTLHEVNSWAKRILTDISFRLYPGECIALVGANGAGKTTLLRHLIGLQRPAEGSIRINGRDNRPTPVSELARDVGLAFQNPDNQFFRFTVEEEIRVGPEALDRYEPAWVEELLHLFQLERYKLQAPYRMRGGKKKRVAFASALARALLTNSALISNA